MVSLSKVKTDHPRGKYDNQIYRRLLLRHVDSGLVTLHGTLLGKLTTHTTTGLYKNGPLIFKH